MKETSSSQFLRTSTGIQSGSKAFGKSRFIMIFLTILGVKEIICSFTFVENTISNLPKVPKANFLGSHGLFFFISICKFGSFKNPFATITSLSELYFRIGRFILLIQTTKMISMNYDSRASSWKPWGWVRLDLVFSMKDIYIYSSLSLLTKFTSSSRSTEFKDIMPWNISQMITKTVPISTRIVTSNAMKRVIPLWIDGTSMKSEITTWSKFPNGGRAIVEQILASEEKNKSKRTGPTI